MVWLLDFSAVFPSACFSTFVVATAQIVECLFALLELSYEPFFPALFIGFKPTVFTVMPVIASVPVSFGAALRAFLNVVVCVPCVFVSRVNVL